MPRIAHSKRPRKLRIKRDRHELALVVERLCGKGHSISDLEKRIGMPRGSTASMIQGLYKVEHYVVLLYQMIDTNPTALREIELFWEGKSLDEITAQIIHES